MAGLHPLVSLLSGFGFHVYWYCFSTRYVPLCEYLLIFYDKYNVCLVVNGSFPVTCNIFTCYVLDNGPFFIFGSLFLLYYVYVSHILHLLYLWVGMILPFAFYFFLVVVLCHWVGIFGFSPDFETFCCFLVFRQELYLPCSGFRLSSGYYFAVRIPASVWLFLWILLRRSHFASVWLSFSFLRCFSAFFLEFCFVFGLFPPFAFPRLFGLP